MHASIVKVLACVGLISLANAQASTANFTGYAWNNTQYAYSLDANALAAVPMATKQTTWCAAQQNTCYQLCDNQYDVNYCNVETDGSVEWACECLGFQTPNVTLYTQTVPSFECQIFKSNCVDANTQNGTASRACANIPCPSQDAAVAASSISASLAAASATSSVASSTAHASATVTAVSTTAAAPASSTTHTAAAGLAYDSTFAGTGAIAAGLMGMIGLAI